jgi:adenylate cyclase class 2
MPVTVEQEVKLRFKDAGEARRAVISTGGAPLHSRRLQEDSLLDTPNGELRRRRSTMRLRTDSGRSILTFKGPVQPSALKVREEIETVVEDGEVLLRLLAELGFAVWFRYEKYREEFAYEDATIAIDETPVGTFVEIEGTDHGVAAAARALGREPGDYIRHSYRELFVHYWADRDRSPTNMLFERE